jgi:beta-glucosidase
MTGSRIPDAEFTKDGIKYTSMGWEIYPECIYNVLMRIKKYYGNPLVYITENGAAFEDIVENGAVHDIKRIDFLRKHVDMVYKAIQENANVKGYFVWSLLDNFEWAVGFSKRFGIVYVDYNTQNRIIKDSGFWYRDLIQNQKI